MNNKHDLPFQYIKGIGPKRAEILANNGFINFDEAINYYPKSYTELNSVVSINELYNDLTDQQLMFKIDTDKIFNINLKQVPTIIAKIVEKREVNLSRGKKLLSVILSDQSNKFAKLNFWNYTEYYKQKYLLGLSLVISGKATLNKSYVEFNHPSIEIINDDQIESLNNGKILPNYTLPEKLTKNSINNTTFRSIVKYSFTKVKDLIFEKLPQKILLKHNLLGISETVENLHFPENRNLLLDSLTRMKFEEIFTFILQTKISNNKLVQDSAIKITSKSRLSREVYDKLPFQLTKDQKFVLNEIALDLKKDSPMNRLLQGDVGSGKTIVALLTMLMLVDKGYQTIFLAPTELLAEQHFNNFNKLCEELDIEITLLTGSLTKKIKKEEFKKIESGLSKIVVGTHALFQKNVKYNSLSLIVIDEQHRFGVGQRETIQKLAANSFSDQNISPHVLVMSATPIPRTLAMTLYANLDVSVIINKPKGRKEIITKITYESRLSDSYNFIINEIKNDRQAYIVFPLVQKSEKIDLQSAEEQFLLLSKTIFKNIPCGIIHSKLKWTEKDSIMNKFVNNEIKILFSTTVIEVGIDVPNASVMLINNAERFGLSQLHQLRGRIGRGSNQSFCILATVDKYEYSLKRGVDNEMEKISALLRLKTMEKTQDGFEIAEADFKIRGPGDMTGLKQSGLPNFKFIDLLVDNDIIKKAGKEVDDLLINDPELNSVENINLKSFIEKENQANNYIKIA
ncbi:ATP-dependent DNA helicase RecG [Candidatus Kapabacteria bacterium]|nr:ATP-dependent DNA helicase RecG [Candidatus Kapabacteria bacterium]